VNLTAQQRTQVQQTVLASRNVPRANNVNFALSVGTLVPTSVRVVDVAPALIEINPAWRGHQYFVVRDDIIIVDHSRKIVAVVPVGSGGARLGTGGSTALNLSSDQIREVQTVLKERGFDVVADGRMGPRTVEAITAFQRQQGFQVSGRIDNQTISSLGLSNKIGVQGSDTTGRGGASEGQSGASPQAPAQQNQGANKPSTSGQGGANQQQAPAQQNQGDNKPSTSGQGGANQQQAARSAEPAGRPESARQRQQISVAIRVPFERLAPRQRGFFLPFDETMMKWDRFASSWTVSVKSLVSGLSRLKTIGTKLLQQRNGWPSPQLQPRVCHF
jgi:peptidoglycan hydrolase-like protein with peptidoglycan-binding domain